MSTIVYQTNKATGTIYAYRSESYRDPVTKRPKTHRTYLGIVDPETKAIVPKAEVGKRNRTKKSDSNEDNLNICTKLKEQVNALTMENIRLKQIISKISELASISIERDISCARKNYQWRGNEYATSIGLNNIMLKIIGRYFRNNVLDTLS